MGPGSTRGILDDHVQVPGDDLEALGENRVEVRGRPLSAGREHETHPGELAARVPPGGQKRQALAGHRVLHGVDRPGRAFPFPISFGAGRGHFVPPFWHGGNLPHGRPERAAATVAADSNRHAGVYAARLSL